MDTVSAFDFLHSLFILKSLLGAEFGNSGKSDRPTLSMQEYVLMKKASEAKNRNADLTGIREFLSISKAAVSQMLSSLERRGLINREVDPQNRRNLILSLTSTGRIALKEKSVEVDQRIAEIISYMGEQDALQFTAIIEKINDALKASSENRRSL